MTKKVSSINGWVRHPEGWTLIETGVDGGFYWLLYAYGWLRKRVIYNQDGREVFCEDWKEIAPKEPHPTFGKWLKEMFGNYIQRKKAKRGRNHSSISRAE